MSWGWELERKVIVDILGVRENVRDEYDQKTMYESFKNYENVLKINTSSLLNLTFMIQSIDYIILSYRFIPNINRSI